MRIYLASSWRNRYHGSLVTSIRDWGHEVYNYRNPPTRLGGMSFSNVDPKWHEWTVDEYRKGLEHPAAVLGYATDHYGLTWCDCCVLVMPSGNDAHLELGYAIGQGKLGIVYYPMDEPAVPGLMDKLARYILRGTTELQSALYAHSLKP